MNQDEDFEVTNMLDMPNSLARGLSALIGLIFIGVGFFLGQKSHIAPFASISGRVDQYVSGNSSDDYTSYIRLQGDSTIYIVAEHSFSPNVNYDALAQHSLTVVYLPDSKSSVDITATDNFHLAGQGYAVYAIHLDDSGSDFTTQDYVAASDGVHYDYWTYAHIIMAFGVVVILLGLALPAQTITTITYGAIGFVALPLAFFFFIGYFEAKDSSGISAAQHDNLVLALGFGVIGLIIGLISGIVTSINDS